MKTSKLIGALAAPRVGARDRLLREPISPGAQPQRGSSAAAGRRAARGRRRRRDAGDDDRRTAAAVWPWLAQMGPSPRGGAYTYDWIENLLGLDMHSVDRVLPEFQHPGSATIGFGANQMRSSASSPSTCSPRSLDGNWVWSSCSQSRTGRRG